MCGFITKDQKRAMVLAGAGRISGRMRVKRSVTTHKHALQSSVCNIGRSVELLLLLLSNAQAMRHALVISAHAEFLELV